jgi:hypothetical protein
MKPITVAQLREALAMVPDTAEAYIWVDGTRYYISHIDDNFYDNMIDITAYTEEV